MIRKVASWFHPARLPLMTRQSYRHELLASSTFPWAVAMVEAGVIGIIAEKVFGAGNMVLAVFVAAPMFANVTSLFWARLARGRPKVRFITGLQLTALALVALIALLPDGPTGAWGLAGTMVICRCVLAGVVTVRSNLWRQNYPRHYRGRIIGRLSMVMTALLAVGALGAAVLLDRDPQAFRWFYPLAALVASVGVVAYSRIRMRGEPTLLRDERLDRQPGGSIFGDAAARGAPGPAMPKAGALAVLRRDRAFRTYLMCQFALGASNMMTEAPLVKLAAEASGALEPLDLGGRAFAINFLVAIALTQIIPVGLSMVTLPVWARRLDRMHIARFRLRQSWFFVAAELLVAAGAWVYLGGSLLPALALLMVARVTVGIARGGGMIAWNLGHNDFAPRQDVSTYMALHVTLTGIRGAVAPFLGMALYAGWDATDLVFVRLPAWSGLGAGAFCIAATVGLAGALGFHRLSHTLQTTGHANAVDPD